MNAGGPEEWRSSACILNDRDEQFGMALESRIIKTVLRQDHGSDVAALQRHPPLRRRSLPSGIYLTTSSSQAPISQP